MNALVPLLHQALGNSVVVVVMVWWWCLLGSEDTAVTKTNPKWPQCLPQTYASPESLSQVLNLEGFSSFLP